MAKQSISVTLEPTTIENLRRLAAADLRNISNMIDYIVAQYVLQHEENAATKSARAAVFGGQMEITPYAETQAALKKNVHIDDADLAYLKRK